MILLFVCVCYLYSVQDESKEAIVVVGVLGKMQPRKGAQNPTKAVANAARTLRLRVSGIRFSGGTEVNLNSLRHSFIFAEFTSFQIH